MPKSLSLRDALQTPLFIIVTKETQKVIAKDVSTGVYSSGGYPFKAQYLSDEGVFWYNKEEAEKYIKVIKKFDNEELVLLEFKLQQGF